MSWGTCRWVVGNLVVWHCGWPEIGNSIFSLIDNPTEDGFAEQDLAKIVQYYTWLILPVYQDSGIGLESGCTFKRNLSPPIYKDIIKMRTRAVMNRRTVFQNVGLKGIVFYRLGEWGNVFFCDVANILQDTRETRPSVNYAKDWLDHSFLFPGLKKSFTLDMITRGQSTTIFLCIGPFSAWWQTNERTTGWS